MANYDDYDDVDPQLESTSANSDPPSTMAINSASLSTAAVVHGPLLAPPWFNDLIQNGFAGLLSIVTKNRSIAKAALTAQDDYSTSLPASLPQPTRSVAGKKLSVAMSLYSRLSLCNLITLQVASVQVIQWLSLSGLL